MADIQMCKDQECPMKRKCYRFTATPNEWQWYLDPSVRKGDKCEDLWDNKGRK